MEIRYINATSISILSFSLSVLFCFRRLTVATPRVLVTSLVPMAAARTIRVSMEEPAMRSVSPRAFGTTVPVRLRLLEDTARLGCEVVRATKQLGPALLDCIQLLMTTVEPSKCSVIFIQSLGSLGT